MNNPDVADIIAGVLQTSRAHAYELMREALAEQLREPRENLQPPIQMASVSDQTNLFRKPMTKQQKTQQVITLMRLIDKYAKACRVKGNWVHNAETAAARQLVLEAVRDIPAPAAMPEGPWKLGEMTGNWRDIDLPDHGGVMRIVWRMNDDIGRNHALEAQARAVVAALNTASATKDHTGVPFQAIKALLDQAMTQAVANGANSASMPDEIVEVAHWLTFSDMWRQEASTKDDGFYEAVNDMDNLYQAAPKTATTWPREALVWEALQAYLKHDTNMEGMRAALMVWAAHQTSHTPKQADSQPTQDGEAHNFDVCQYFDNWLLQKGALLTPHSEESDGPMAPALNWIASVEAMLTSNATADSVKSPQQEVRKPLSDKQILDLAGLAPDRKVCASTCMTRKFDKKPCECYPGMLPAKAVEFARAIERAHGITGKK